MARQQSDTRNGAMCAVPQVFRQVFAVLLGWIVWQNVSPFLPRRINGYILGCHALFILGGAAAIGFNRRTGSGCLRPSARVWIAMAYASWGLADGCWAINYFITSSDSKTALAIVVTSLSGLAFVTLSVGILASMRSLVAFFDWRVVLLSMLVAADCIATILLMPYAGDQTQNLRTLFAATELFASAASCFLLALSVCVLLSSRQMTWSVFGAGAMCWVLGDSSIRIGKLLSGQIGTDAFTVLCSFGIYASLIPWLSQRSLEPLDAVDTTSLFTLFKGGTLVTIFACLLTFATMQPNNLETVKLIALCCGVASFACIFLAWLLVERIRSVSTALGSLLQRNIDDATTPIASESLPLELREYYDFALARTVEEQRRRQWEVEERYRLLRKVAHNILSPVAALKSQLGDIARMPEESRVIIKTAIHDINDLAGGLASAGLKKIEAPGLERVHILSVVESVLRQKRSEMRGRRNLLVERRGVAGYGVFADVEEKELKSIISNLVNNAADALAEGGEVVVTVDEDEGQVHLRVSDNGAGIPPDRLRQLGVEGATFGKEKGSGIGLFHAKSYAEAWGGDLRICSEVGHGTDVMLRIPAKKPTSWFVGEIACPPGTTVVVLDDNPSIHKVWEQKLAPDEGRAGVAVAHFTTVHDFTAWLYECPEDARQSHLYLLDFELDDPELDGVQLAQDLGISSRSILVTSHDMDSSVRQRCVQGEMKLLPKAMAGLLPVRKFGSAPATWDAVFIDDDAAFRKVWTRRAAEHDKVLAVFSTFRDFLRSAADVDRDMPIYIDSNLESEMPGELAAKRLREEFGFTKIYLATAYASEGFSHMHWLTGVIGKLPPWPAVPPKPRETPVCV